MYDCVCYLILTHVRELSQRDHNIFKSLHLWKEHLTCKGWHTYAPCLIDSTHFLFVFQLPWQRDLMNIYGWVTKLIDSTHSTVSNLFVICWVILIKQSIEPNQKIMRLAEPSIPIRMLLCQIPPCDTLPLQSEKNQLLQIVIWDTLTRKVTPICWAFTASAAM